MENKIIIAAMLLLFNGCSIKPSRIFSERECSMSRSELVEVITNILLMNNFTISTSDSNMISGVSDSDVNLRFDVLYNKRAKVEKYFIKWDFIISKTTNNENKFKVISSCYKINNELRLSTYPYVNYSKNVFPVGKHYRREQSDAALYYAVIDVLRHICGTEIEYYFDDKERKLYYDIKKNKFYRISQ